MYLIIIKEGRTEAVAKSGKCERSSSSIQCQVGGGGGEEHNDLVM